MLQFMCGIPAVDLPVRLCSIAASRALRVSGLHLLTLTRPKYGQRSTANALFENLRNLEQLCKLLKVGVTAQLADRKSSCTTLCQQSNTHSP